jgi:branched-chain amino acid transport system ATP-binding protein
VTAAPNESQGSEPGKVRRQPSAPALELDLLEVRHGAVHAVRGVSLSVDRGEIVGLIGPNGAGKSSTLHAIMGLVPASGGDVRLHGRSLLGRRPEDVARAGVALVPEGRRIFAELTVQENLSLGTAGRRNGKGGLERAYELFPAVHESRSRQAGALSGGQQQQLAIARALVADPEVLLLDEPSLGLAPRVVDVVFEALQEIKARGLAILLVEQRAQRTVALADRSHVLSNGRLRLTLGPEAAADSETLVSAYFS